MKALQRDLEIYLSLAGLLLILFAIVLISPLGLSPWLVGAVAAVLISLLHGLVFWLIRRRQRQIRQQAFNEIQLMLKDLINNQLTVIQTMSSMRGVTPEETSRACDYITRSVNTISRALHDLSEESLQRWQRQYDRHQPAGGVTAGR